MAQAGACSDGVVGFFVIDREGEKRLFRLEAIQPAIFLPREDIDRGERRREWRLRGLARDDQLDPNFLALLRRRLHPVKLDFFEKGSPRCFSKNQVSLRPATVATPGMFEGAGITDTTTRRLSIPVLEEPTCVKRMAEGGTPLRISSRRTASARSTAVFSPASLLLLVWTTKIVPLPAFRAALATMSAATGDNAELPGRKNTAALGDLACSSKDFRAIVVS